MYDYLCFLTLMLTGGLHPPVSVVVGPDDPIRVLLPNCLQNPEPRGLLNLQPRHMVAPDRAWLPCIYSTDLAQRTSGYFPKSNLPLRTKIRLLRGFKGMIHSDTAASKEVA